MLSSLKRFSEDEVASERLRIIEFYEQYGEKATLKAFKASRKTIFVWKKKLKENKHHLASLIPASTRPKTVRRMTTNLRIVSFISKLREKHPGLGKEKIKPLLDKYCQEEHLSTIAICTIGKVIKRNNLFFQRSGRIYHNPSYNYQKRGKTKRVRIRQSPKPQKFGYLEMDTVLKFVDGIRYYVYSAIDVKGKIAFSYLYRHLNSQNTVDFFKKLEFVFPYRILIVQTDNGLEFLGDFEAYLKKRNILHVFIYPRCCRINGVVERYQRSLQEEYIDNNLGIIHNPTLFNQKLIEYLLFFITERVHKSLDLKTPIDYLLLKGDMSKMSVAYTKACK